ncbi:MAG: GGDEF domain-containing protein [Bdellovibrionales bacterium]|jgi:diguanylate cyclase (GGDEF)-like protein|nr:GGDEF domain-containing protein [Bdellovibrionales bacterium]
MAVSQSGQANQGGINPEKTTRLYIILVIMLFTAIVGAGFLHHHIGQKQTALMLTAQMSEQQMRINQMMTMLVDQNQKTPEPKNLERLRAAASNAQQIEPRMLVAMHAATWSPLAKLDLENLQPVRQLTDKVFSYAAFAEAGQRGYAREYAEQIAALARQDVGVAWHAQVSDFIASRASETQKIIFVSYAFYAAMLALLAWQAMSLVMPALNHIAQQREHLQNLAAADALTGLYNRSMLFKVVHMLISSARRHKQELAVLSVNVDGTQKINDKHGRAGGDKAIRVIADTIAEQLRNSDVIGRVGGDEFALFLPSTDEYRAGVVAEKIRTAVEAIPFSVGDSNIVLTISIGVADIQPHHKSPDDMLRAAEYALRHAKQAGRNRAVTYSAAHQDAAQAVEQGATGGDPVQSGQVAMAAAGAE